jgi:hypothetical protein
MEGMQYFYELFEALPRGGPGDEESKHKAVRQKLFASKLSINRVYFDFKNSVQSYHTSIEIFHEQKLKAS